MKLIIDISDEMVKALEQGSFGAKYNMYDLAGCVMNGTPIEQEQKTGHWILTDDDFVYCSECEDSYYPRPIDASWYYCPHCGARMSEVEQ